MNRALLAVGGAGLLGLAVWAFTREPGARPAGPVAPVTVKDTPQPDRRPPVPDLPAPKAPATAAPMPPKVAGTVIPAPEPEVEVAQGPFEVRLGKHTLQVRGEDPGLRTLVELELVAVTATQETQREMSRRRAELVRMLFFLGSHRAEAAIRLPEAETVFASDLLERFRNAVRSGEILELKISNWRVYQRPALPPGGEPPPE